MGYFTKRYEKLCPDFKEEYPQTKHLRINALRGLPESTINRLKNIKIKLKETPLSQCYEFVSPFSPSSTTEYLLGLFYLQGFASQAVAHALAPKKEWLVVDLAAAPGSKTTHLAQLMNNTGKILAIDSNLRRLNAVRDNIERLGVKNVITIRKDARYAADLKLKADAVLLDAPCSGNYCSEEDWESKRTIDDIKKNSRLQKDLFIASYKLLKSGGVLMYSTCSLEPEENEIIIDWALSKYDDLTLEKIPLPDMQQSEGLTEFEKKQLNPEIKKCARFWPHKTGTEGFFVARLRKK